MDEMMLTIYETNEIDRMKMNEMSEIEIDEINLFVLSIYFHVDHFK